MLTRFVRIQLAIFAIVSIISVVVMIVSYMQVPTLLGVGRITVTLELPAEGGLYRFANVTYRGVQVGTVTAVGLTDNGAKATLSLGAAPKIPADLAVEVRSISAVGEQYVDLRPRTDSPPYLRDGAVISAARTTIPQPVGPMLDRTTNLINSIPKDKLGALIDESFAGLNGSGYHLQSLLDSSAQLVADANSVSDRIGTFIEGAGPLLDSQAETADSIRLWARSLAGVSQQVAADDAQVRTLLHKGPGAADEASRLLDQVKATLPVLLANLTTIGQIGVTYHPSIEQLLVLVPPALADFQSALPSNNYTGLPVGAFHIAIADPSACTVGFLPPSQWRSPADTTTVDTPDGLYCKLPQDSPLGVRGARNYPCMGQPGKRAPTVEICESDKPFEPLAMRQHMAGPYPLDPNLLSQGIPPDDRINRHDDLYGPPQGTPRPPMQQFPAPPELPPHPTLGPLQMNSAAGPAPPGLPAPAVSAPPLGPLAPMDTPDAPASAAPPAPALGAKPSAAPSSFGERTSGKHPSVAFAKYNPLTGSYVGPDGNLYGQSDLVASSDHKPKTWKDLILTQT